MHCLPKRRRRRVEPTAADLVGEDLIGFTADGAVTGPSALRARIAQSSGIDAPARARLWPHLLGMEPWDATAAALDHAAAERSSRFERLLQHTTGVDQSDSTVIGSDVPRTDREHPRWREDASLAPLHSVLLAHCVYRAESKIAQGYLQGMNDLAAVVCEVLGDEPPPKELAAAFWLFEALLDHSAPNWSSGDVTK